MDSLDQEIATPRCTYCEVTQGNGREVYRCELCHTNLCSDHCEYIGTMDIVCIRGTECARAVGRDDERSDD